VVVVLVMDMAVQEAGNIKVMPAAMEEKAV
jgi:hypothetical protein